MFGATKHRETSPADAAFWLNLGRFKPRGGHFVGAGSDLMAPIGFLLMVELSAVIKLGFCMTGSLHRHAGNARAKCRAVAFCTYPAAVRTAWNSGLGTCSNSDHNFV